MVRYFWQPILGWFGGIAICFVITSFGLRIGWKNPSELLIWGYAMIGSTSMFAWNAWRSKNTDDRKAFEELLNKKADVAEIQRLQCVIDIMQASLDHIVHSQEEQTATVEKIYDLMLETKHRKGGE
jgi:hypothetical protein